MDAQPRPNARQPEFSPCVHAHPRNDLRSARHSLSRWLRRHGAPRDEVEDVIQYAFVRLCRAERAAPIRNVPAFLTAAAKRIRIDRWRCARREARLFLPESADALDVPDAAPQPQALAETGDQLAALVRRLEAVSPRTREIFFQHRLEGRTYAEIAASLGISVSAVEKHIARTAFALTEAKPPSSARPTRCPLLEGSVSPPRPVPIDASCNK
jgi:RNA polymerase sigma factor (sigma-70 family)